MYFIIAVRHFSISVEEDGAVRQERRTLIGGRPSHHNASEEKVRIYLALERHEVLRALPVVAEREGKGGFGPDDQRRRSVGSFRRQRSVDREYLILVGG